MLLNHFTTKHREPFIDVRDRMARLIVLRRDIVAQADAMREAGEGAVVEGTTLTLVEHIQNLREEALEIVDDGRRAMNLDVEIRLVTGEMAHVRAFALLSFACLRCC